MTEFKAGDQVVTPEGETGVVGTPPFTAHWVRVEGTDHLFRADDLSPVPPVDPRVDVIARTLWSFNASGITWEEADDDYRRLRRAEAVGVLAVLDAHDRPAEIRDKEGDPWYLNADGTYTLAGYQDGGYCHWSYERLSARYGPLTPAE